MAFINNLGQSISFDCSEQIEKLKADIAKFGNEVIVEVVTEKTQGVTVYKDYALFSSNLSPSFKLSETESLKKITASALLDLYEEENSIL